MEEPKLVNRTCVVCGKTFTEIKHPKGNKRKFCSHECEVAHRREYRQKYFRDRYENDEEYRERVKSNNAKYGTAKRQANKEKFLNDVINTLANTSDTNIIRQILEENFRLKSEKYDKNARTLRLSKESSS